MKEKVSINGDEICFSIQKKSIKNINLKVDFDKNINISIPNDMSIAEAKKFVIDKYGWIQKQIDYFSNYSNVKEKIYFDNGETVYLQGKQFKMRLIEDDVNSIILNKKYFEIHSNNVNNKKTLKRIYGNWMKQYSENQLQNVVEQYHKKLKKYEISLPKIELRQMKNRWGSCLPDCNKIIFNKSLIKVPDCCIEYVVLHEMTHLKYKYHNKAFYNFLTVQMPDWKERKKILDEEYIGVV